MDTGTPKRAEEQPRSVQGAPPAGGVRSTPGVLGGGLSAPEMVTISGAEHALYSSGIRRGHCETLNQIRGQLGDAAAHYRAHVAASIKENKLHILEADGEEMKLLEAVLAGYDSIAEQLGTAAGEACREAQRLLVQALQQRRPRPLSTRLRAAMRGAIGGWRGE